MGTVASRQPSSTAMIRVIALLPCLVFVSAFPSKLNSISHNSHHGHHDEDVAASRTVESYLSPVEYEDEEVAASRVVDSYLIPVVEYDEEPAASQAVDSYLVPDELPAAQEPVRTFAKAPVVTKTLDSYFGPPVDREAAPTEAKAYYAIPQADVLQPQPSIARKIKVVAPTAAPVAILRSSNTGPQDGNYAYSFETENGISQSVEGRMKMVDETPVYVMKGEYEYPGADGQMWKVEWYADETGYHPSAPFLPKNVVPNHPEVAAAVEAQLRFAAEEEAAAAASINEVFVLPEGGDLAGYGAEEDLLLAGYGEQDQALDSYATSYGRY